MKKSAIKTKAKPATPAAVFPLPKLAKGEHYAGVVITGAAMHHLILLPGEGNNLTWDKAVAWAKKKGGELPTRSEQAILYGNLKDQFQPRAYWSNEAHASYPASAWCQLFGYGSQFYNRKVNQLTARAVRRLTIQ